MKLRIESSVAALLVAQASVLADDTTKLEEIIQLLLDMKN